MQERMILKLWIMETGIQRQVKEGTQGEQELMKVDYEDPASRARSLFWKLRKTTERKRIRRRYQRKQESITSKMTGSHGISGCMKGRQAIRDGWRSFDHTTDTTGWKGNYFELKQYFSSCRGETIRQNADLMVGMC